MSVLTWARVLPGTMQSSIIIGPLLMAAAAREVGLTAACVAFRSQFVLDATDMDDQIIDAAMALSLHADAVRTHPLAGWIIMRDPPDYEGKFVARLVTTRASPYVLVGDTLAEVQAALPPNLKRSSRQPSDLLDVVEIWFAG
jgi:hypothetical protein